MLKQVLAIFWRFFALILILFLATKFYITLSHDPYSISVLLLLGGLFYVLFLLEGLQIAGLQLKEQCEEAILRFLSLSNIANDQRILRIAELYKNGFHSFLSGRQILVIMSVVSLASIINSLKIPVDTFDFRGSQSFTTIINSPVTNFLLSTLLPAWISQLLPQFIADNRSISFISLPGAEWITRLAIKIDKIQASRPAFDLLDWTRRSSTFSKKEKIHVGRKRFYESLSSYIGISRDKVLVVVCGDRVTERSIYHVRKEKLVTLRHKIRPQSEIDEFNFSLSAKESIITGKPSIEKSYDRGGLFYILEIALSFDENLEGDFADITVINEYTYKGMAETGSESILFETDIPTRTVSIVLMHEVNQKISNVSIDAYHYTQRRFYDDDSFAYGVVELSSGDSNHRIDIDYPLYGIEYRVAYDHQLLEEKSRGADSRRQCDMQVTGIGHSEKDREDYHILSFTLSTQGLDEFVHLKDESLKTKPH